MSPVRLLRGNRRERRLPCKEVTNIERPFTAVICALNAKYVHSSLAPWCLLAGINEYCSPGITADVVEGTINEAPEGIAERILEKKPDVVGLSCYIWNIGATLRLANLLKSRLPRTVVVLGGPEVSYNAGEILHSHPFIDYVVSGEGELPFALLLNALAHASEAKGIPGVCGRSDGQIFMAAPHTPGEEPPSPYTEAYFAALGGRIAYLETSRGCPYACAFCLSGRCGGVRYYSMERVKDELLRLANSGAQTVKLIDRTFNANRKRAVKIIEFILQNYGTAIPRGVCFHFEVAGDLLDDETIALLAKTPLGAIQLEIGLQSFNPKTLEAIHRKTEVERLKANIARVTSNGNMHIHIDLIAGLPYEDYSSFAQSFNTAYALRPNMLQLGFLKLLHGSTMREHPEEYPCSYSPQPPYEVTETPWLTAGELERLHLVEDAVERLYNSGRFKRTLEFLLGQLRQSPFELFERFGAYHKKADKMITLDDYTALVYNYFSALPAIDPDVLRDVMVCDRLATNASGRLPPVLYRSDKRLKAVALELEAGEDTRLLKSVKRGVALLYTEHCAAYVDYRDKNPVTGEYTLHRFYPRIDLG